jgi:hypothetical protein
MYESTIDMQVKQQKLTQGDMSSVSHKNMLLAGQVVQVKTWEVLCQGSDASPVVWGNRNSVNLNGSLGRIQNGTIESVLQKTGPRIRMFMCFYVVTYSYHDRAFAGDLWRIK